MVFETGVLNADFLGQQLKFFILSVFQICSAKAYLKAPPSVMCSQFCIPSSLNEWHWGVHLGNTLDVTLIYSVLAFKTVLNWGGGQAGQGVRVVLFTCERGSFCAI